MGDRGCLSLFGDREVEQHPIPDLIAADQYVAAKAAADKPGRGIRITQLIPGGTIDDRCGWGYGRYYR
jgi:hypothetical protein